MDALGRKTCGTMRTVKPCGSGSPMLESTLAQAPGGMVAKKPGTPGRARSSRKAIAQGVPGDFGVPVLACVRSFVLHAWQWVRRAPGIPCALSFSEGHGFSQNPDAIRAAGMRFHVLGDAV